MPDETVTLAKAFRAFGFDVPAAERYEWLKDSIENTKAHSPGSVPADFDPFVGKRRITKAGCDMYAIVLAST